MAPSSTAGYSGTALPKKLGIKPGSIVRTIHAPKDFPQTLGSLPEKARLTRSSGRSDITLWFVRQSVDLESEKKNILKRDTFGSIWICWPKKASGVQTDLNESSIRNTGLDFGLVDYKICAIDAIWSGLLFTWRK
jgi:hypothetical protein